MQNARVSRALPQALPDTSQADVRGGRYGEQYSIPILGRKQALADEGSFFIATNPTPGTPIAVTTSITSFAETAGAVGVGLLLRNIDAAGGKRVYLDYLKLMIVQVPTSATSWQWALVQDQNPIRYTSGGSAITPVSPNGDIVAPSVVQMYFGALTTAVPTSRRTVGRGTFRGVIPTTFDEYMLVFGSEEGGGHATGAAASGRLVGATAPVILGPGQNLALTMWGTANAAAPSFEFEMGWAER